MSAETTGQLANIPFKPPTVVERALAVFTGVPSEEALKTLTQNSATITTITNQAGYDQCHSARMLLKNTRLEIAKTGEAGREDAVQTSKAIIARQKTLISITQPEEERLQKIQDAWDAAIEAEKEAKIQAEVRRGQAIQARITELRNAPLACTNAASVVVNESIALINSIVVDDSFEEFKDEAAQVKSVTLAALRGLFSAAIDREDAAEKLRRDQERLKTLEAEETERQRVAQEKRDQDEKDAHERKVAEARAHAEQIRKDNEAQEANRQRNEMAMQELSAIHHQLMIADTGRSPYFKGGTIEGHDYLIDQTEKWPITEEKFGALFNAAQKTKENTIATLRQKRVDLIARLAHDEEARTERQRIADEKAANDTAAEAERQRQADETARIAEQRRQLETDQAAHAEATRRSAEPTPPFPAAKPRVRMTVEFDTEEVIQILIRHYKCERNQVVYFLSATRWAEAAA